MGSNGPLASVLRRFARDRVFEAALDLSLHEPSRRSQRLCALDPLSNRRRARRGTDSAHVARETGLDDGSPDHYAENIDIRRNGRVHVPGSAKVQTRDFFVSLPTKGMRELRGPPFGGVAIVGMRTMPYVSRLRSCYAPLRRRHPRPAPFDGPGTPRRAPLSARPCGPAAGAGRSSFHAR